MILEGLVREAGELYREVRRVWDEREREIVGRAVRVRHLLGCWPLGLRVLEDGSLVVDGRSLWEEPELLSVAEERLERAEPVARLLAGLPRPDVLREEAASLREAARRARALGMPRLAARARVLAWLLEASARGLERWILRLRARLGCWDRGPVWGVPWRVLEGGEEEWSWM